MYTKILDILNGSSLGGLISQYEIKELASEIEDEVQMAIDDKVELEKEELQGDYQSQIDDLKTTVKELEEDLESVETCPELNTMIDVMLMEWINENWDLLKKVYLINEPFEKFLSTYEYGKMLMEMGNDVAPVISKMIDEEILKEVEKLEETNLEKVLQLGNVFEEAAKESDPFTVTKTTMTVDVSDKDLDTMRKVLDKDFMNNMNISNMSIEFKHPDDFETVTKIVSIINVSDVEDI